MYDIIVHLVSTLRYCSASAKNRQITLYGSDSPTEVVAWAGSGLEVVKTLWAKYYEFLPQHSLGFFYEDSWKCAPYACAVWFVNRYYCADELGRLSRVGSHSEPGF